MSNSRCKRCQRNQANQNVARQLLESDGTYYWINRYFRYEAATTNNSQQCQARRLAGISPLRIEAQSERPSQLRALANLCCSCSFCRKFADICGSQSISLVILFLLANWILYIVLWFLID